MEATLWTYMWSSLWNKLGFRIAIFWLVFLFAIAIFANIIYAVVLDFSPFEILESEASYQNPLSRSPEGLHIIGTDHLGRDLMARLLYGTRHSILLALFGGLVALSLGLLFGLASAYFGNEGFKQKPMIIIATVTVFAVCVYCWYWMNSAALAILALLSVALLFYGRGTRGVPLPVDGMVLRLVEFMRAIPSLIILIAAHYLFDYWNFWFVVLLFGVLSWPRFAVFIRSEILGRKMQTMIDAARLSGISNRKILLEYLLPDLAGPITVIFLFTMARIIIVESSLAFVGIYYGLESVSWGEILAEAGRNVRAWWITLFPILAITTTIYALLYCSQKIIELKRPLNAMT